MQALAVDPRYDTVRKRAQYAAEIVPRLRAALQQHSALEWEAIFGEAVPCAAARAVEDMFVHEQVLAEQMVAHYTHPEVGGYRGFDKPVKFGSTPGPAPFASPSFGQHAADILAAHGYSEEEIARLRSLEVLPERMA